MTSASARLPSALAGVIAMVAAVAPGAAAQVSSAQSADVAVIVRASDSRSAESAVRSVGGDVRARLPIVDGVAARVPADRLAALRSRGGIRGVTPDSLMTVASVEESSGSAQPTTWAVPVREIRAHRLWGRGTFGQDQVVALVDTGVADVPALAGRVLPVRNPWDDSDPSPVACVNFSGESTCNDSYGHGTFLAGLIAGTDWQQPGVAPGARIISLKLAGRDGSADVSKVLVAIQWVVSFRDTYGIDVLNLSLGTDSTNPREIDPLNYAVERAWDAGIVVVVSASNRGPNAGTISKPADDPLVITVGATDDVGTASATDDAVPAFTGRGPAAGNVAKPDVAAPGVRVASLRAPGSLIETQAPGGGAGLPAEYRRGSGTSMATALVSGAALLLRQVQPTWTPDQVKLALMSTAQIPAGGAPTAVGRGVVNVEAAADAAPTDGFQDTIVRAGSRDLHRVLEASRGTLHVSQSAACALDEVLLDRAGCAYVDGNETGQGRQFAAAGYTGEWTGSSWYGSSWYGSSWYGSSWYGSSWYGDESFGGTRTSGPFGVRVAGSSWYGSWE